MTSGTTWSRRTFLSTSGLVSASTLLPSLLRAQLMGASEVARSYLACTVSRSSPPDASPWQIRAYAVRGSSSHMLASMSCPDAIGAIAIHPQRNVVYVAHDTEEYLGLPRASVSSFVVDEPGGGFMQLSREALTLSATRPRHLAISPDGKLLLVAATGGGAYNALHLAPDGSILPHKRAIKLVGCGPHPLQSSARPLYSRFARSSDAAYACDFGSDRIDQLRFANGVPSIESRVGLEPGTGPCHLAIHPSQRLLAVVGYLRPTVTMIAIDLRSGRLGTIAQLLVVDAASLVHASFCASGTKLSVAGITDAGEQAIFTFQVDRSSLTARQTAMECVAAASLPEASGWEDRIGFPLSVHNIAAWQPHQQALRNPAEMLSGFGPSQHEPVLAAIAVRFL